LGGIRGFSVRRVLAETLLRTNLSPRSLTLSQAWLQARTLEQSADQLQRRSYTELKTAALPSPDVHIAASSEQTCELPGGFCLLA